GGGGGGGGEGRGAGRRSGAGDTATRGSQTQAAAATRRVPLRLFRMIVMKGPELGSGYGYRARVGSPTGPGGVMTTASEPATLQADAVAPARRRGGAWLLLAVGLVALCAALAVYIRYAETHALPRWVDPVDLQVYRDGGLIVRHLNFYHPHRASPLYDWPGFEGLPFTYPPFAALVFTVLTVPSYWALWQLAIGVNIAALLATIWMTLGGLGYIRGLARLGATLLFAGALFWTEPVQRTLFLGQIELVLMALVIWDQCQPDRRWWKGAGIGIAAGIKLV